MIKLAECTTVRAGKLARDPRTVIVLPLGAVEQHGPHLPLLVDWLGAEELARRLAPHLTRAGFLPVLVPSLPYGVSTLAIDWIGTASLSIATLQRVIVEIVRGLARHGFRRFVLTNYQADPDHLAAMERARRALARDRKITVVFAGFAPGRMTGTPMVNRRVVRLMRSSRPDAEWHSGELETAVVLSVRPDLVKRNVARRLPPAWVDFRGALARGVKSFRAMNPAGRGYFGSPAVARASTGRKAMALRAALIAREVIRTLRSR